MQSNKVGLTRMLHGSLFDTALELIYHSRLNRMFNATQFPSLSESEQRTSAWGMRKSFENKP
jgi:hypothetical protein